MIHPTIDKDYPAGVSAFRQLIAGARPTFHANSWDLYKREGYDHLYFRGLALRHSNGETGKYETYTYEATQELLLWAKHNVRPTFDVVIAKRGIDERREIRNLRRRSRYAEQSDCYRGFPSVKRSAPVKLLDVTTGTLNEDGEFSSPGLTQWYVAEYCRINGLRP